VGLRYGIFTPTEAGAMTVVYALLVGFLAHRELRLADLPEILTESESRPRR
jgi:TRAP-type C4-dicarboxylate transport system permease large subunit